MSSQPTIEISPVGTLCQRNVVSIEGHESIYAAAERMRQAHVGCLVVTEPIAGSESKRLDGMLTDRDIVVSVVARKADPGMLKVSDVMSRSPLTVSENTSVEAALSFMQDAGVRRIAVTGEGGELIGIVSLDDVLQGVFEQIDEICASLRNEVPTESHASVSAAREAARSRSGRTAGNP